MSFWSKFTDGRVAGYTQHEQDPFWGEHLNPSLLEKLVAVNAQSDSTSDLVIREFDVDGIPCALMLCEGMFNLQTLTKMIMQPLAGLVLQRRDPQELLQWVRRYGLTAADQKEVYTYGEVW